jgi:hypothetical protein
LPKATIEHSGGPVFNAAGQVRGVNCTSYEGQDISFHLPLEGILNPWARDIELIPEDPTPHDRDVFELGLAGRICFDPPLAKIYIPFWWRIILWPGNRYLDLVAWIRWKLRGNR